MFCHATEEEEKVLRAFRNALPENLRDKKADTEMLRGLYGNKILKLSLKLVARKRESRDFMEHLRNKLSEEDRNRLVSEASERIDGSGFFFRLDKQEAYHGRLKVADGNDTIEVRLTIETFVEKSGAKEKEMEKLFRDTPLRSPQ